MLRMKPLPCLLTVLFFIASLAPAAGAGPEEKAARLFERRFKEHTIKGTGHLFRIVVACDAERLATLAGALGEGETKVVEYEFMFLQNTKQKKKARIKGSGLDAPVDQCIIDRYYKEVTFFFGPFVPEEIPNPVRFPAVLVKGKEPMVPVTPIGFIGPE